MIRSLGTWVRWRLRGLVAAVWLGLLTTVALVLVASDAQAHGTMQSPPSRTYTCRFLDSPERPTSPACRAAIASGAARRARPRYATAGLSTTKGHLGRMWNRPYP